MKSYESRNPANMLVTLGDNDYTESPARFRANWRRSFGWARRTGLRVAGVLGNHDYEVGRGRYQFRLLGMPGPYYTRRLGDAQLFFLDSTVVDRPADGLARAAARRIDRDLEDRRLPPPAVHLRRPFRRPARSSGAGCRSSSATASSSSSPGTTTTTSASRRRNGVTYVVHGGGGAGLYRLRGCPSSYPPRVRARVRARLPLGLDRPGRPDGLRGRPARPGHRITFSLTP